MKTVEITLSEQALMMAALRIVNRHQKSYMKNPAIRKDIKARVRLWRKMVKLSSIRGNQFCK